MRKFYFIFFILFILPGLGLHSQTPVEPSGDGDTNSPYQINTLENLYWIAADVSRWDKHYIQTADIDASETSGWFDGEGWTPIGNISTKFTGTYDGQGYVISELTINRPGTEHVGLFGYILSNAGQSAEVVNLGLVDVNITGGNNTGGLTGYIEGAWNAGSNIMQCYVTGVINGAGDTGGLVGYTAHQSYIENSYTGCEIISTGWRSGGISGGQYGSAGEIVNCYSSSVFGGSGGSKGGLVGQGNNRVTNSFWDTEVSGITISAGGTGKTTAEMKTQSTFTDAGWDFDDIWDMDGVTNDGYPFLKVFDPVSDVITWTGTNNTWDIPGNWSPEGVPDEGDNILIPITDNDPVLSDFRQVGNLEIESGASLTITENGQLTVDGDLTNAAGAGGLIIQSSSGGTGSLIHNTPGVEATIQRYITGDWSSPSSGWHLLSSPVAGQSIDGEWTPTGAGNDYDFYVWDEPSQTWLNQKVEANNIETFVPGIGYMVSYQQTTTNEFTSTVNVVDVTVDNLTNNPGTYSGWNLLGNPFSSAILWDGSWTTSNIQGSPQVWSSQEASYSAIDNDVIPAMNGFMVQTSGNGSVTIPESKRVHDAQPWYKNQTQGDRLVLVAVDPQGQTAQRSMVVFRDHAQEGIDPIDTYFLAGYAPEFYSKVNDHHLALNALPEAYDGLVIPFGFVKNNSDNFRIELLEEIAGHTIYLIDKKLSLEHKLTPNSPYTFTSYAGDNPGRFELRFGSGATNIYEPEVLSLGNAWFYDNILYVNSLEENTMVGLFDINGRKLRTFRPGTGQQAYPLNLPAGLYIVRMSGQNSTQSIKIVVQ